MRRRHPSWWLALILVAYAAAACGSTLSLPFIGDDFVFLDRTRDARFAEIWSLKNTDFGWYRPWSRDFHFWLLQRVVGLHAPVFRGIGVGLWLVALCLYAAVVRRISSSRVAAVATLGVASLALWGTPLLWISGSQDLWMLCFAMASILLFVHGRRAWAIVPFGLALLSKETAAVLPALLTGYLILLERRRLFDALRGTTPLWTTTFAWLVIHPTLHTRLLSMPVPTGELEHRPSSLVIAMRTILSAFNLDAIPRPLNPGWEEVLLIVVSAVVLAAGTAVATRDDHSTEASPLPNKGPLMRLGLFWMLVGWLPMIVPTISWHAYYGCLGVLGVWLALAVWLETRARVAIGIVACLALLRGAQANTPSWDWGNESHQRRAGNILSLIQIGLVRQHPTLPAHARVFLSHIPNNIGLIAGESPALRVWYRDRTLSANFYSHYRPRGVSDPPGEDYFFRFDSLRGMVELKAGAEDVARGMASNPDWERDHEALAMVFLNARDVPRAAREFEKLSDLPRRGDAAGYAAVCWEAAGDTVRAESLMSAARSRMGFSREQIRAWAEDLRGSFPGR